MGIVIKSVRTGAAMLNERVPLLDKMKDVTDRTILCSNRIGGVSTALSAPLSMTRVEGVQAREVNYWELQGKLVGKQTVSENDSGRVIVGILNPSTPTQTMLGGPCSDPIQRVDRFTKQNFLLEVAGSSPALPTTPEPDRRRSVLAFGRLSGEVAST
jgi:hypothetical protein